MQKGIRVGASFNLRDPAIIDLLKNRVNLLRPAVDDFTFNQIKATILDSYYYKGEHPYKTARRLRGTFTETYRNRARTIARTETNWAMSEANLESMKRAEVPFKKWLATQGACEECAPLNKEVAEVGRPFSNGWNSPADSHPNCRCAVAPKMRKGQKPSRYWDGESLQLIEDVPRIPGIPQLGRLPGQVVSFNTSPYTAIPKGDLIGKTTLQMREMSKTRGIKYFRVMNKDELITVLTNPSKAAEIGQIARARWMKTGIKPPTPTATRITDLAAGYEKKSTAELMRMAQSKHIPNFRVMRKKELITVLSDPSKYDDIQLAVKTRLRVARGTPGKRPGTTRADELGLTDIEARKTKAIDTIAERSISLDENRSTESFRSRVKKWLREYDIEVLEAGAKRNLTFELYKTERDVRWRSGSRNFSGIYCRNKIGLVRWNFGYRPSTFNHEMGHFIQDSVPSYHKVATINHQALIEERTKAWIPQAHRFEPWQEKWQYIVDGGDKIVSKYAMHSSSEHFAEAIKCYMDPKKNVGLQAVAPKLYNRIKIDVFKGKEFYAK
jgi:SPP1 gp7 family putative phage head morphogenesis protein